MISNSNSSKTSLFWVYPGLLMVQVVLLTAILLHLSWTLLKLGS